ncbi:MAG TPA: hypothetical protein VEQ42_12915 [Pyrinomonadaceae bacterium]|nr:hypothetical protein [Pyrinomonadaceae bacterium]
MDSSSSTTKINSPRPAGNSGVSRSDCSAAPASSAGRWTENRVPRRGSL